MGEMEAEQAVRCALHAAGACRSCPHLDVAAGVQVAAKQARVARLLGAGANPVPESAWCAPALSAPDRFRNKAKLAVSGNLEAPVCGLAAPDGSGVDLRECPLHVEAIERAIPVLAAHARALQLEPYSIPERRGELKHLLITASPDGELMVRWVLRSRDAVARLRASIPALRAHLPALAVASANIQPIHQAIIEGPEEVSLWSVDGAARLLMRLTLPGVQIPGAGCASEPRELPLLLPTQSFFQTNTGVAEQLYATAAAWSADVEGAEGEPLIWDLFCGVGGFALALAGGGRRVRGVEVSASAIEGARQAAAHMGLGPDEVSFVAGDARVLDPGAGEIPDLLVVNPPRRGIGADLAARIEAAGVPRVLYSSCNPESLARDLAAMPSYTVRRAQLFDMFPHTDHAEVLIDARR